MQNISATELLYNEDSYLCECSATVLSCEACNFGGKQAFDIVFDRTVFFPCEGGQESDTGVIITSDGNKICVTNATIKNDVIHHIAVSALSEGTPVTLKINFEERFDKMQQHSGEHLISGYVNTRFGFNNVGFHLGESITTLDFDGTFTDDEIAEIETFVNKAACDNVESRIFFPTAEELKTIDYRSKKDLEGSIRIVEFPGYDICACCAPHVKRTGEIGMIKILSAEHFRGGTRMTIKCGLRALAHINMLQTSNRNISRLLSVKPEETFEAVNKLSEDYGQLRQRLYEREEQIALTAVELRSNSENPVLTFTDFNADIAREAVNKLTHTTGGYCCCFLSTSADENADLRFIISSSSKSCKPVMEILKSEFGAKGGGSDKMIQGTVSGRILTEIDSIFQRIE